MTVAAGVALAAAQGPRRTVAWVVPGRRCCCCRSRTCSPARGARPPSGRPCSAAAALAVLVRLGGPPRRRARLGYFAGVATLFPRRRRPRRPRALPRQPAHLQPRVPLALLGRVGPAVRPPPADWRRLGELRPPLPRPPPAGRPRGDPRPAQLHRPRLRRAGRRRRPAPGRLDAAALVGTGGTRQAARRRGGCRRRGRPPEVACAPHPEPCTSSASAGPSRPDSSLETGPVQLACAAPEIPAPRRRYPATLPVPARRLLSAAAVVVNILVGFDWAAPAAFLLIEAIQAVLLPRVLLGGMLLAALRPQAERRLDDRPAPRLLDAVRLALGLFLLHNLIEFSLFEPNTTCLFALLAGSALGVRLAEPPRPSKVPNGRPGQADSPTRRRAVRRPGSDRRPRRAGRRRGRLAGRRVGLALPVALAEASAAARRRAPSGIECPRGGRPIRRRGRPRPPARRWPGRRRRPGRSSRRRCGRCRTTPTTPSGPPGRGTWRGRPDRAAPLLDAAVAADPSSAVYRAGRAEHELAAGDGQAAPAGRGSATH